MPGKIVLPKVNVDLRDYPDWPIYFLGGPDFGGGNWQEPMFKAIQYQSDRYHTGNFLAAIPCRLPDNHPLRSHRLIGDLPDDEYQLGWEREWMERAARSHRGSLLFWLPKESASHPRTDGEPYARDTRGELGEWRGRMMHDSDLRVLVGGQETFPGIKVIQRNFLYALGGKFTLHPTIASLAEIAVRVAKHA